MSQCTPKYNNSKKQNKLIRKFFSIVKKIILRETMMILEKAPSISFHCAGKKTTFNG
jgi:hypothetical protein